MPSERVVPIKVLHQAPESGSYSPEPVGRAPQTKQSQTYAKSAAPVGRSSNNSVNHADAGSKPTSSPATWQKAPQPSAAPPVQPTEDCRVVEAKKKIAVVLHDIEQLEQSVNTFSGKKSDKIYLKLEEELTKKLLRLDEVNASGAPGEEEVRAERKAAIRKVQQTLDVLELKVAFGDDDNVTAATENEIGSMSNTHTGGDKGDESVVPANESVGSDMFSSH